MSNFEIFLCFILITVGYAGWSGSGLLASVGFTSGLFVVSALAPFIGFFLFIVLMAMNT